MSQPSETFDVKLKDLIEEAANYDLHTEEATKAMKNLETYSKCRPPAPAPEPIPDPVPTTWWGKAAAKTACALDNETARTIIKAGGAFAGVALVVWSTVHRDHVLERPAIAQANQRPS